MSFGDAAPRLLDGLGDRALNDGGIRRRRQIRLQHAQFRGFLVDQILAATLAELIDRILALLDESGHDLQRLRGVERAPAFDLTIH